MWHASRAFLSLRFPVPEYHAALIGPPIGPRIHRPDFHRLEQGPTRLDLLPADLPGKPSMWISYAPLEETAIHKHVRFCQHHLLPAPEREWEHLKVGGGTPPVRVPDGWLVFYHGVSGRIVEGVDQQSGVCYSAEALLLAAADPRRVLYRTRESILAPEMAGERVGIVPNVIFPTGVDLHPDASLDLYYGMADSRIGVAHASLAQLLPSRLAAAG